MIKRGLASVLEQCAKEYPVCVVTGPRQSGKTTLCKQTFPDKAYVNLETMDMRRYALEDPRGLLAEYNQGAIFDEVQRVPELLSYLQEEVDRDNRVGRFVLTGSQHFALSEAIAQSLAGRTAVLQLLPLSWTELRRFNNAPHDLWTALLQGSYPRIYDQNIAASRWLADYETAYLQRDVRQITQVSDLAAFADFIRLCAGSTSQELNLSRLGSDVGVSHNTARAWLSILETSFLCFRLRPWHRNLRKQRVKTPKLHFLDSGLICHLLGIHKVEQLRHHPLRGAVFESWVVSEILKERVHRGLTSNLYHYRATRGSEVDLLIDEGFRLTLLEIKSAATVRESFFDSLRAFMQELKTQFPEYHTTARVVFGGDRAQRRSDIQVVPWNAIASEK